MNAQVIPERIFKIAADYEGIPFDFKETDDILTIVLVDGRKIVIEKEQGRTKRIQQAEAEQAEAETAKAEAALKIAQEALRQAQGEYGAKKERSEAFRSLADGKSAQSTASTPPPAEKPATKGRTK